MTVANCTYVNFLNKQLETYELNRFGGISTPFTVLLVVSFRSLRTGLRLSMIDLMDTAGRAPWFFVYLVAGVGVLLNLLGEAYSNALVVCEMYPQFSFLETLWEEVMMHHTWIPLVYIQVPTLHLLSAYVIVYAINHWGLLQRGWPLLVDLLSGRWLYRQLVEVLSTYLPFVFTEPDMPELLSDDETRDEDGDQDDGHVDNLPPPPVDDEACNEALAKLVQVKMQHANRTIPRPDDWLVFDPVQEKLVLQKHMMVANDSILSGHSNVSKIDLQREQEPIEDSDQTLLYFTDAECAGVTRTGKDTDTGVVSNQPSEVLIRKQL